MRHF